MSLTNINICNIALSKAGITKTITALTGTDILSVQCNNFYENIRDEVLEMHPWPFAKRIEQLCYVAGTEYAGWDYTYEYPDDAVKIRRIFTDTSTLEEINEFDVVINYDLDEKYIVAKVGDEAYAEYTAQVTDPDLWSKTFINAMTTRLASELIIPLTTNPEKKQELLKEYQLFLDMARLSSAEQGYRKPFANNTFMNAR